MKGYRVVGSHRDSMLTFNRAASSGSVTCPTNSSKLIVVIQLILNYLTHPDQTKKIRQHEKPFLRFATIHRASCRESDTWLLLLVYLFLIQLARVDELAMIPNPWGRRSIVAWLSSNLGGISASVEMRLDGCVHCLMYSCLRRTHSLAVRSYPCSHRTCSISGGIREGLGAVGKRGGGTSLLYIRVLR